MGALEEKNCRKYKEKYRVSRTELRELLKRIDAKLFGNRFSIEGQRVIIPYNKELDVRIKYEIDDDYSFSIKVSWDGKCKTNDYEIECDDQQDS